MNNKTLFVVVAAAIFTLGAGCARSQNMPPKTPEVSISSPVSESVKEFTVAGSNFSFAPSEIRVKKGDRVKITFKNEGGMHDLVLDEFNARTPRIGSGESRTVEFTVSKTGTFEYYCSVAAHREMGMKGRLTVE